jgi:hypothetical protein
MRRKITVVVTSLFIFCGGSILSATETEQDIINRFLKKTEAKHVKKISWIAANFTLNRINRDNDYNKFANYSSTHFSNTNLPWIGEAKSLGIELGLLFGKKFAWSVGGEYWFKMGTNQTGLFNYTPPNASPSVVDNLISEVTVWGVSSAVQYYIYNPPSKSNLLTRLAVRVGGSIGYYQAQWDLWDEYQNLNLATSAPTGTNTTFKGSAPAFSIITGVDYPLPFLDMALGIDVSYLYLNFSNVAWYNQSSEEIVATYNGASDGRVDLGLSGVRGKVELKRFFKL